VSESNQQQEAQGSILAFMLCLTLPVLVTIGIWFFSPNYKFPASSAEVERVMSAPLGGDFLQEYVGGTIWNSVDRHKLYDLSHSKTLQHNPEVVGFSLDEKSYFPMVYPPFHYALFGPLARFDYKTATLIWSLLVSLALSLAAFSLWRFYPPMRGRGGLLIVGLIFIPLLLCLNMGQKSTFLLAILTFTFLLLYHQKDLSAGLVFGLIAFKPHLGLLIGLIFLWKGRWKFAAGSLVTVALLVGSTWFLSHQLWTDYQKVVLGMGDYVQTSGYNLAESHSLWGAIELGVGGWFPAAVKPIAGALSLVVIAVVGLMCSGPIETRSRRFAIQFSGCVVAMVLLSPHFYTYDLTMLLLPMFLTVVAIPSRSASENTGPSKSLSAGRPVSTLLWAALFLGAGLFVSIADSTHVQPSLFLLFAILVALLLATRTNSEPEHD
jgi:hypothetical protein